MDETIPQKSDLFIKDLALAGRTRMGFVLEQRQVAKAGRVSGWDVNQVNTGILVSDLIKFAIGFRNKQVWVRTILQPIATSAILNTIRTIGSNQTRCVAVVPIVSGFPDRALPKNEVAGN